MARLSILSPWDRARKAQALVLQRLADRTQTQAAADMKVSETTMNRIKTERLEEVLLLISHLGLKVVPADFVCVDGAAYAFLTTTHERVMKKAPELIWEQEE